VAKAVYKRVLLKISGEGLAGPDGFGVGGQALQYIVKEIVEMQAAGVQVALVVGGGNILRGSTFAEHAPVPKATAHYMGMMATVINALALQETFQAQGVQATILSSVPVGTYCEPFDRRRCINALEQNRIAILAGGTGRPFVTTDTAAAVAAAEIEADVLMKATQVDGVYSGDPRKDPSATFYEKLSFDEVLQQRLEVMDLFAVDLCRQNNIDILVFNMHKKGNLQRVTRGEAVGTVVSTRK
jgi:uridylate kinase